MPTRVLRDWTDSLKFEDLSAEAERLFVRLKMKADDFGRFHADPRLIRAACFPLSTNIEVNDVSAGLSALEDAGLLEICEAKGRRYLALNNFRQRLRTMNGKFPPPDGKPSDWAPDESGTNASDACQTNDGQLTDKRPTNDGLRRVETSNEEKRNEASNRLLASGKAVGEAMQTALRKAVNTRPAGEAELIENCKRLFGAEEMAENGGLWRTRARENASKLGRCLSELQRAIREGEVVKNRAAYITDLWGRFHD
jgi:hypothetical protein